MSVSSWERCLRLHSIQEILQSCAVCIWSHILLTDLITYCLHYPKIDNKNKTDLPLCKPPSCVCNTLRPLCVHISTLECEIKAVSRGVTLNTHLRMAHIPGRTNGREWGVSLPNPRRNAQRAGGILSGHPGSVFSLRQLPPLIQLWDMMPFTACK